MNRNRRRVIVLDKHSAGLSTELPQVFINLEPAREILCLTNLASGEINGIGNVEGKENNFIITETFVLPQKTSGVEANMDPMALNEFVGEYLHPEKLTIQWHSHGGGAVVFSTKDIRTIERWLGNYLISLLLNKRGDYLCRLDLFEPVRLAMMVPLWVIVPTNQELISRCEKEIDQKVNTGVISKIAKRVFKRDGRFSDWTSGKRPIVLPFGDLAARWPEQ